MKRIVVISVLLFPILLSCDMLGDGAAGDEGELKLSFDSLPPDETRSGAEIPDTNDFLLCVSDAEGDTLYEGAYGDAPESMMVRPGNYCVRALSGKFSKPAFSSPQYGDEQCIVVESGESAFVRLLCSQMNSGVRLKISSDFLTAYSGASLLLRSSEGSLMYSYSEKRIAYFNPGNVSLVLSKGGSDDVLMTRWLEPGEILSLGVGVSSDASSGSHKGKREISISVDTSRVWKEEFYVIGGGDSGGDESETAMGITQAMSSVGTDQHDRYCLQPLPNFAVLHDMPKHVFGQSVPVFRHLPVPVCAQIHLPYRVRYTRPLLFSFYLLTPKTVLAALL